ncbi:MAG TPA: hypothetical protein VK742_07450, partial [Candidatus Sulfotelmatobacter sp.]|nr:hypothetical protein [Candidatus Sulfotelmatobacter sp.]
IKVKPLAEGVIDLKSARTLNLRICVEICINYFLTDVNRTVVVRFVISPPIPRPSPPSSVSAGHLQ